MTQDKPTSVFDQIRESFTKTREVASKLQTVGPTLRFTNYELGSHTWKGTVMFVAAAGLGKPSLTYTVVGGEGTEAPCTWLDTFNDFNFYRFAIEVPATDEEQAVNYQITIDGRQHEDESGSPASYTFYVPARDQDWRMSFYSCNGWQAESVDLHMYEDISILWNDMLAHHGNKPFHCMLGGGDQIYNDPVFDVPSIREWLNIKDCKERALTDMPAVEDAAAQYYFSHYCEHWSTPGFKQALASIPSLMTWDDHDIFDGWGSYPQYMQESAVFKRVFKSALRFYLLFQNHATPETAAEVGLFGGATAWSWMAQLGPKLAVLGPDSRTARSKTRIIPHAHWEECAARLDDLPDSVKHLMVVFAVPFVYGEIPASESVMSCLGTERRGRIGDWLMQKTGLLSGLMDKFGEPNLADDIGDHWTSRNHEHERNMILKKLQDVAALKKIRVTFLSGDVHVGGVCRITSDPDNLEPLAEPDYMLQVVSSAIGNSPPPKVLGKVLNAPMTSGRKPIDNRLFMHFLQLFKDKYPHNKKLLLKRNWCDIEPADDGSYTFTLRVEDEPGSKDTPIFSFSTTLPALKA